jgi:hypothetical protein
MDMVDWNRSMPYSVQEIRHALGVEVAYQTVMRVRVHCLSYVKCGDQVALLLSNDKMNELSNVVVNEYSTLVPYLVHVFPVCEQRLGLALEKTAPHTHPVHVKLIADMMTFSGDANGFTFSGFQDMNKSIGVSAPFTEASVQVSAALASDNSSLSQFCIIDTAES